MAGGTGETAEYDSDDPSTLQFSLAGVQLTFSVVLEAAGGLTVRAHGRGGDWIVKLPAAIYDRVAENEYSVMSMAAMVGIHTPKSNSCLSRGSAACRSTRSTGR